MCVCVGAWSLKKKRKQINGETAAKVKSEQDGDSKCGEFGFLNFNLNQFTL